MGDTFSVRLRVMSLGVTHYRVVNDATGRTFWRYRSRARAEGVAATLTYQHSARASANRDDWHRFTRSGW